MSSACKNVNVERGERERNLRNGKRFEKEDSSSDRDNGRELREADC